MSQQNEDRRYNGFTNKYTWLVNVWLDNDYGLWSMVNKWSSDCDDVSELAEQVKDFVVDETNPLVESASMYSDILGYALAQVDFLQVVESYWDERDTDDEDNDDNDCVDDEL